MTRAPLPNPERAWERRPALDSIHVEELERHLGERIEEPFVVLTAGLANTNVRIGSRVVRLYRRDASAATREAALLSHAWKTFRVPRVLRQAPGALVLEYVEHSPLLGNAEHGYAAGLALAEIHATPPSPSLSLERFDDLVGALVDYAQTALANERAAKLLSSLAPKLREVAGPSVLLHADFKASNLHWTSDQRLLVLDWEFAYWGSALSDIGQLMRWDPPAEFVEGFASGYRAGGGELVADWPNWAAAFDLVNLAGLLENQNDVESPRRVRDVSRRIEATLALFSRS